MAKLPQRNATGSTATAPQPPAPPAPATTTAVAKPVVSGFASLAPIPRISTPSSGEKVPWLTFYSDKSRDAVAMSKSLGHLTNGQAVLKMPDGEGGYVYHRVERFQVAALKEYYTQHQFTPPNEYTITRAALQNDAERSLDTDIVALVLCHLDAGVVAAVAQFRKSHAVAAQVMAREIGDQGGDWQRVVGDLTYEQRIGKSKYPYVVVSASTRSISAEEFSALQTWLSDPDAQAEGNKVIEAFKNKCASIEAVLTKEQP